MGGEREQRPLEQGCEPLAMANIALWRTGLHMLFLCLMTDQIGRVGLECPPRQSDHVRGVAIPRWRSPNK